MADEMHDIAGACASLPPYGDAATSDDDDRGACLNSRHEDIGERSSSDILPILCHIIYSTLTRRGKAGNIVVISDIARRAELALYIEAASARSLCLFPTVRY